jgi:hypothetical protein
MSEHSLPIHRVNSTEPMARNQLLTPVVNGRNCVRSTVLTLRDWEKRDEDFAEKIERAAKEMREQPERNVRITANELGRRSGTHAFLHRQLDKLPKVREVLARVVESIEAFAIRRIETVRNEFLSQGQRPTRSQFMYRAGLSNKVKQSVEVQAAIEDALQLLADTVPIAPDARELNSLLVGR